MNRLVILFFIFISTCAYASAGDTIELSLSDAVKIARENNPLVLKAKYALEASRGRRLSGLSPASPVLTLSYEEIPYSGRIGSYGERSLAITQAVEFPATTYFRAKYLSSLIDEAGNDYFSALNQATSDVRQAYYDYLLIREEIRLALENLDISTEFAHKAEMKLNAGEGTALEKLTAKVQKAQSESALNSALKDEKLAYNDLMLSIGFNPPDQAGVYIIKDSLVFKPLSIGAEELARSAGQYNPALRSAVISLNTAGYNHSLSKSSYLPGFELSYFNQSLSGVNNYYGFSVGMTLPLWFLLDQSGKVEEASAGYDLARVNLLAETNKLLTNIKNLYLDLKNEENQVETYTSELLPQAGEIYRIAFLSYEAGEISYLELLQARQTLLQARSGHVEAMKRYFRARVSLDRAVGAVIE